MALPLETDPAELQALTDACTRFVLEHLSTLDDQPAADVDGAEALSAGFREPWPRTGAPLEQLLQRLRPAVVKSFNTAGPGYMAFIPGGGLYSAALADYVALATNRYVGVNKAAPVLAEIERVAIRWLADAMGYSVGSGGVLTTGGSLSTFGAVVTARSARLAEGSGEGTLYFSSETHHSVAKAARLAGFTARALRPIAVDGRRRMIPEQLAAAMERDRA